MSFKRIRFLLPGVTLKFSCADYDAWFVDETMRHFSTCVREPLTTERTTHVLKRLQNSEQLFDRCYFYHWIRWSWFSLFFAKFHCHHPLRDLALFPIGNLRILIARDFRADILSTAMNNLRELWLEWRALFFEVSDRNAFLRNKCIRISKNPWINTKLEKLMHRRDGLKIKAS